LAMMKAGAAPDGPCVSISLPHCGCPKIQHPGYPFCDNYHPGWGATSHTALLCAARTKSAASDSVFRIHELFPCCISPPNIPPGDL